MTQDTHHQRGFTLIEVAATLLILSIFIAAAAGLYQKSEQQRRALVTRDNMKQIVHALSTFAESAGRLPCPADPGINDMRFGWEWNITNAQLTIDSGARPSGSCGNVAANAANNDVTGLVPFQSLNLPAAVARDGWGRYFTYAVSPVFAQNNDRTGAGSETDANVHAQCRTHAWVNELDTISSYKARFCCAAEVPTGTTFPPATTDIRVRLTTDPGANINDRAEDITPARTEFTPDDAPTNYFGYGGIATMTTLPADGRPEAPPHFTTVAALPVSVTGPAFVLLSHGDNGDGSFLANGTRDRLVSGRTVGADEDENNDYDRIYFTGPQSTANAAATYFDDTLLWMTQDGIMAANGTSSCQYP